MAKINLRCGCGFVFFADEERLKGGGSIQCPSCLSPVGIDGPVAGAPAHPRMKVLSTAQDAPAVPWKFVILGAAAVGVVGLGILIFALSGGDGRKPGGPDYRTDDSATRRPPPTVKPPTIVVKPPTADAPAPAPKPPAAAPKTPPPPMAPPPKPRISDDLLKQVRSDLLALPAFYQALVLNPTEKARVQAIVDSGEGGKDDTSFLGAVLTGIKLRAVKAEAASVDEKLSKLSTEALEGAPMDRVVMNDGRVLNCWIMEETPETVRVERKMATGVGGMMSLKRSDVKEALKGKGAGAEFKTRWEAARKGARRSPRRSWPGARRTASPSRPSLWPA